MEIEQAIEKAGYHPSRIKNPEQVFLDPLFWQSLGKAMGWSDGGEYCRGSRVCKKGVTELHKPCVWEVVEPRWKGEWHRFIDHLAEGKTAEDYFKNL